MKRTFLSLLAIASLLFASPVSAGTTYTLDVSPATPTHGDYVTFTGTFPQEAFKQSRQPQYPGNPQLSLNCGNTETTVMQYFTFGQFKKTTKNPDGSWNATSPPILLDQQGSNGIYWPADTIGVVCSANTGYWLQLCAKCGPTWFPVASKLFSVNP